MLLCSFSAQYWWWRPRYEYYYNCLCRYKQYWSTYTVNAVINFNCIISSNQFPSNRNHTKHKRTKYHLQPASYSTNNSNCAAFHISCGLIYSATDYLYKKAEDNRVEQVLNYEHIHFASYCVIYYIDAKYINATYCKRLGTAENGNWQTETEKMKLVYLLTKTMHLYNKTTSAIRLYISTTIRPL